MAQPITCDNTDGTLAFIVMTQPATGDVTALCGPCLLEWAEQMLIAAGVMDQVAEKHIAATMAAAQQAGAQSKPARKAAAKKQAAAPQDTGTAGESTAEPATEPQQ